MPNLTVRLLGEVLIVMHQKKPSAVKALIENGPSEAGPSPAPR